MIRFLAIRNMVLLKELSSNLVAVAAFLSQVGVEEKETFPFRAL